MRLNFDINEAYLWRKTLVSGLVQGYIIGLLLQPIVLSKNWKQRRQDAHVFGADIMLLTFDFQEHATDFP